MARARTLALCGLDRGEEQAIREFFPAAVKQSGISWALVAESDADALLIDVDSMYGQMTWLRAQGGPRPIIALTSANRADADFLLPRPATESSLAQLLKQLSEKVSAPSASAEPTIAAAVDSAPPTSKPAAKKESVKSAPAPAPVEPQPARAPEPPRELQLVDFLRDQRLPGPVRLSDAEPPVIVDPIAKLYIGGSALKPFLPLAQRKSIDSDAWQAITSHEFQRLAEEMGGSQPLQRLLWLAGLGCGNGELHADLSAARRFKLAKYPTTEREFPKHIRLATAMLKQLSTVDELVAASGLDRADVCDFINACYATALIETDQPAAIDMHGLEDARQRE